MIDPKYHNEGFARKIGYAQQLDMSLPTMTVREALVFSARLRQPKQIKDVEKLEYVDEVLHALDLANFANAVIGNPGDGLNIEQRKRVTIGVELVARPELLLFLDEPTSGLDSESAWSICCLLRKLADSGHAILCTIHQPSATLFEMFDRLLFLKHGQCIYFGNIGADNESIIKYFTDQGARACGKAENPAEWLMVITTCSSRGINTVDWHRSWQASQERQKVKEDVSTIKQELLKSAAVTQDKSSSELYATPFLRQLYQVTRRNLSNDWRTPTYLYSKLFLTIGSVCMEIYLTFTYLIPPTGPHQWVFLL